MDRSPGPDSKHRGMVAVIGTGPAGLMAADVCASHGCEVHVFEKRKSAGRKLLVAGSSGLNITYDSPVPEFARNYSIGSAESFPESSEVFPRLLEGFPPRAWIEFIEGKLGIATFKGTSRRYFVEGMKASQMLKAWVERLEKLGVRFHFQAELRDFGIQESSDLHRSQVAFANGDGFTADAVCFCLGGGSWEPQETPLRWPAIFTHNGLGFTPFQSSNVGFQVDWPEKFLKETEGQAIKNVVLTSSRGSRAGDLVVTRYGLEGTPIYFAGIEGEVALDLKPDLTEDKVFSKLTSVRENLSPIRRVKRTLNLGPAAFALVFHLAPPEDQADLRRLAARIKRFPVVLKERQPLQEAISSSGGVRMDELDSSWMFKKYPGFFAAGEMLDWDAPTGGFLIQGSVAQGFAAGRGIVRYLESIRQRC